MNSKKAREIMREHQSGFVKLNPRWCAIDRLIEDSEKLELEERKVGKWICVHHLENKITYDSWKCSQCQYDFNSEEESMVDFDEYKYCPNCGAEMGCEE